ncbi:MAG: hypothetical protein OXF06_08425 [Bacteroidetes bacterium]|nr:hypothetical protein [Bacteroidota bacterium]
MNENHMGIKDEALRNPRESCGRILKDGHLANWNYNECAQTVVTDVNNPKLHHTHQSNSSAHLCTRPTFRLTDKP